MWCVESVTSDQPFTGLPARTSRCSPLADGAALDERRAHGRDHLVERTGIDDEPGEIAHQCTRMPRGSEISSRRSFTCSATMFAKFASSIGVPRSGTEMTPDASSGTNSSALPAPL